MSTEIGTNPEVEESKEAYWRRVLQEWQASGLKGREYQRRHALSPHAFVYWKLKLMGRTSKTARLVAVNLRGVGEQATQVSHGIRIHAGELFSVEVSEGFNSVILREVLAAVRDCAR